jgi:hypothetical protein
MLKNFIFFFVSPAGTTAAAHASKNKQAAETKPKPVLIYSHTPPIVSSSQAPSTAVAVAI